MSVGRKNKVALPRQTRAAIIRPGRPIRPKSPGAATNGNAVPPEIPALPPGVCITTLDNGLVVIVREDHSAPVVAAQAWCNTGSISEGRWLGAGLSHVLEHMLFKGTTSRPGSRIDQEVQEAGGYMNAYTSFDRTVYHINVPNTGGKVAIDILCDIMQNASLPPDELAKELDVIRREMDMNQDDPGRRSSRRLFETVYTRSPYRFTVIGYPDIFNELQPADIAAYYRERYVPNNMFFVVAGDIRVEDAVAQIREGFAKTKARPIAPMVLPVEPRQTAAREMIEEAPIELGYFHFAWHIPDVRHPDTPALDILSSLLGNGRSSRFFRELREKKGLVTSADAWIYSPGEQGLFGASAVVTADKFQPARHAILEEIRRVQETLVPPEELAKVIKQFVAGTLGTRKTMQGQAQDLGANWMAANDLNFSERYLAAAKRVTPETIRRVAREYLIDSNRSLYALLPKGLAAIAVGMTPITADQPVQKIVLPNGLRLLIKEDHRLPFVEFRAAFRGGVLAETAQTNGLTQLTAKMLLQGTGRRTAEQIAHEIESMGGSIDTFGGNNSFGLSGETLSEDLDAGLDVFADVMLNPAWPSAAFERERQIQFEIIRGQRDHLLQSCGQAMRRGMFGKVGYGLDPSGTAESVEAMRVGDLAAFHRRLAAPENCVLAVFGDVNTADLTGKIQDRFGAWKPAGAKTFLPESESLTAIHRVIETREKKQAVLIIGFPGVTLRDHDRYALELLQEGCSDLGSRLFLRIRDNLGLAYYVGAQNFLGMLPGYFAFYVGTAPEKLEQVEAELLKETELLRSEGFSPEELKRSKAKIIGQKKIARQELGGYALTVALDELYGLGHDHIDIEDALYEAVTMSDIQAVARKYLTPDRMVVAIIKPV
jgi:zinc protease